MGPMTWEGHFAVYHDLGILVDNKTLATLTPADTWGVVGFTCVHVKEKDVLNK